eukprot:CAMPEP_0196809288 /NCGR_PEP_ID=MMETSP1362-20130617/9238_1 /TAXON_ID=163516 /ORGANISM="Leptocylindrus danicus, Strain CCMP1856" /LENGTH=311 /DNA_ID=CAMNT_0042183923 /DNA_START=108 /DNA_END=1043 /DNA_ORIENTATION=+
MPGLADDLKTQNTKHKKKKNKYAQFSKQKESKDPWDLMIEESLEKRDELEKEREKKDPRIVAKKDPNEIRERNKFEWPDVKKIDPYDPTTYGYVELGVIVGAHGVKGELKLFAGTDFAEERLCRPGQRHLRLPNRRSPREIRLVSGRKQVGDYYLISLEGVLEREGASKLKGSVLYARQDDRPEFEDDEYLVSDIVGLKVVVSDKDNFDDAQEIGSVVGIVLAEDVGSIAIGNDMLEIALQKVKGQKVQQFVLIPFVPAIVHRVELSNDRVHIDPPSGLLDLTYVKEEKVRIKGFLPAGKEWLASQEKRNA